MKRYLIILIVLGLFTTSAYCQDAQTNQTADQAVTEAAVGGSAVTSVVDVQPQEISIYGEIKSVNPATSSMTIQYYDYDSDEERSIDIITDNNTKMENASSVADIKAGNWADVIYATAGGKNLAKSVIVEKDEETPPSNVPAGTTEGQPAEPSQQ